jgi:hypothetical protein
MALYFCRDEFYKAIDMYIASVSFFSEPFTEIIIYF